MAKPIKETSMLTGKDASRFEAALQKVVPASKAERRRADRRMISLRRLQNSICNESEFQTACPDDILKPFDCGDSDLNGFFIGNRSHIAFLLYHT